MSQLGGEVRWWGLEFGDLFRRRIWMVLLWMLALVVLWVVWPIRLALLAGGLAWVVARVVKRYRGGRTLADHAQERQQAQIIAGVLAAWVPLMHALGIALRRGAQGVELPLVTQCWWADGFLFLRVTIPLGLSRGALDARTDVIAENLGARLVRVFDAPGGAVLRIEFIDRLADSVTLRLEESVELEDVPLGIRDDGYLWTYRLGPHTLVAGCSGSGKASLVWGLILGVAPAIRAGLVQVHGVDLKGAMELGMGRNLLTRFADTPETAVQVLEDAVAAMQERARQLSGVTRQHTPTVNRPHVVILIDEIAALTAYLGDRDLVKRANSAIAMLCSQGRAVGYTVFACLQDPRKETLPMRGLFTQTIGLRLRDATETAMVLGDGMRDRGALCDRIPASTPGVAYVVPEDGGDPLRVRARFAPDELIREAAARFPAPVQVPVIVRERQDAEAARAGRRTRNNQAANLEEEK
jgi:S-DNA-T family DNA segregation ATPase FtsK/SpoIIIE